MSASLALAIVGTLIALAGLLYTRRERRDRIEQVALLRRQVEASERQADLEAAAHDTAQRADIRVKWGGRSTQSWRGDLVNGGAVIATSIQAWIIDARTGETLTGKIDLRKPLLPGEFTEGGWLTIPVGEELLSERRELALMLSWIDSQARERRDEYPVELYQ